MTFFNGDIVQPIKSLAILPGEWDLSCLKKAMVIQSTDHTMKLRIVEGIISYLSNDTVQGEFWVKKNRMELLNKIPTDNYDIF